MSAQPKDNAAPDLVDIEIDGKPLKAPKGSMIIQAADAAGIPIPRFCYHRKLAVAANCRQCLVEVEKMPKLAPSCATSVADVTPSRAPSTSLYAMSPSGPTATTWRLQRSWRVSTPYWRWPRNSQRR